MQDSSGSRVPNECSQARSNSVSCAWGGVELARERHALAGGIPTPDWNVSWHLEVMDQLGIQTSVLAITTPGARIHPNDTLDGRALARKLNEYAYHELVQKYPGRFQFWATVTLPDVEGAIAEAIHAFDNLGAVGVFLEANKFGIYLGDPSLDPFFKVLDDYKAVVLLHPNALPDDAGVPGIPAALVDFMLDTTRAALNLVFKNTTRKFPNVRYVLAHSGGFLPFVVYRFAFGAADADVVLEQFKDYYFDTALSSSPSSLPSTMDVAMPERITYGTDFPYASKISLQRFTNALDTFDMPEWRRARINCTNALELFNGFKHV
ncbi:hypothetical protein Mapa_017289 [Marchantia paleacea]|nr:hypothetical protein Mapa_017289 [Marchantia paleacea]